MLNTDATSSNLNIGGLGGVFRNSQGEWVMGYTAHTTFQDIALHELQALFVGLQLAVSHDLKPMEINVDAEQLSTLLNNATMTTNVSTLLSDCRFLLQQLGSPTFTAG
ncbi:hypothetical protein FXO37_33363 [Capsicum annuum]|nr:hypothetical protein FXO37_33363 [Capsicum annuum]